MAEWTQDDERFYQDIVHNLRSQGWERHDALEEADRLTAKHIASRPTPPKENEE